MSRSASISAVEPASVDEILESTIARFSTEALRAEYLEQGNFLVVDPFLPGSLVDDWRREIDGLADAVHRSYIPGHKQGGSVGFESVLARAPSIAAMYRSPTLLRFVRDVVGAEISTCPLRDTHSCALYVYTRPGDHIGFHYDTSYYRGARFTVLVGVTDESSSALVCRLHTRTPGREVETREVRLAPGALAVFDGDSVEHAVTPLREGEHRTVVTMQYVTSGDMRWDRRIFSDLKDAVGYFGFREVFLGRRRGRASARRSLSP